MLSLSQLHPVEELRDKLVASGVQTPVYDYRELPSADLPDRFIAIRQNGAIRTESTGREMMSCFMLIEINVRLMSNGKLNSVAEGIILKEIEDSGVLEQYIVAINSVFSGRSLYTDYSTKMVNVKKFIHN